MSGSDDRNDRDRREGGAGRGRPRGGGPAGKKGDGRRDDRGGPRRGPSDRAGGPPGSRSQSNRSQGGGRDSRGQRDRHGGANQQGRGEKGRYDKGRPDRGGNDRSSGARGGQKWDRQDRGDTGRSGGRGEGFPKGAERRGRDERGSGADSRGYRKAPGSNRGAPNRTDRNRADQNWADRNRSGDKGADKRGTGKPGFREGAKPAGRRDDPRKQGDRKFDGRKSAREDRARGDARRGGDQRQGQGGADRRPRRSDKVAGRRHEHRPQDVTETSATSEHAVEPAQESPRAKDLEPELPEDAQASELHDEIRRELRGLPKVLADKVAVHLVAAGQLMDTDPERALVHARFARKRASRVASVREANGLTAYQMGEWNEALSELRAARRMAGGSGQLAIMADCERALGRPERALDLSRSPEAAELEGQAAVELRIVAAGARRDLGQVDASVVSLQGADLDPQRPEPWSARLFYAYADNLLAAGRVQEAFTWFVHAAHADDDEETDAPERLDDLVEQLGGVDVAEELVAEVEGEYQGEGDGADDAPDPSGQASDGEDSGGEAPSPEDARGGERDDSAE